MIIDENIINGGITPELLARLIRRHNAGADRFKELLDYYKGIHNKIIMREKRSKAAANNKIVCNHAKYIVDMTRSYLLGNPVKYESSDGYDITTILDAYLKQDIASTDSEIAKMLGIYGRAYELIYADCEGNAKSTVIPPDTAFVVYNDDCTHAPILGVRYYLNHDIEGNVTGCVCDAYDADNIYSFKGKSGAWDGMELQETTPHYFGSVPLLEHINNTERQGDFEQEISLIDAYNVLSSDRVNDKMQFVESFLFLAGIDLDSDTAKKLKAEKILIAEDSTGDAKYLSSTMQESDIKVLRDDIKEDIHRFSMVPDLSDQAFGGNLSGVAIKYKLIGFEQMVKNKERYLTRSLLKRFEIYNHFFKIKKNMAIVPSHRIDVVFTHNLPANNLETAQMLAQLDNMLSLETKLAQLDFISDAEEEAELVRKEKEEVQRQYNEYRQPIVTDTYDKQE